MSQTEVYNKSKNPLPTILKAWLLAGTLDGLSAIIYATIRGNKNPEKIFSYIASGLFGKESGMGETAMILWGVLFHFIIAFIFTVFFFFIYPKVNQLLNLGKTSLLTPLLLVYKLSRKVRMDSIIKSIILPGKYKTEINELDIKLS